MKFTKIGLLSVAVLMMFSGAVKAQNTTFGPEWGESLSQEERLQNALIFNYYSDAYNNKDYDTALRYLDQLLEKCPKAKVNIYVWGTNIYKNKIARLRMSDPEASKAYTDSLFMLYDKRLESFADHPKYGLGYTLKNKAKDFYLFRKDRTAEMIELFQKAIDANMDDVDPTFINQYFSALTDSYKALEVETDMYLNEYDKMSAILTAAGDQEDLDALDGLLVQSGAANCDNLEKIYSTRLEDATKDVENRDQLAKAFNLMGKNDCYTDFFFKVGERYMAIDPSSSSAMILAKAYEDKGDIERSNRYLKAAVDNETDPVTKAQLCVQIAGSELKNRNSSSAAKFAREAIGYNGENGYAYICLAQAYADGAAGCSDAFERGAAYWLAYDTIQNARRIFAGDEAQLATVQTLMNTYQRFFPSKEDCFFHGITAGQGYTVNCGWVSGRTTVK